MTKHSNSRRTFIRNSGLSASALMLLGPSAIAKSNFKLMSDSGLKISLAEWSLNKEIKAGELLNLDFAAKAREFGINGILAEYIQRF